jgi:hypothetical protein
MATPDRTGTWPNGDALAVELADDVFGVCHRAISVSFQLMPSFASRRCAGTPQRGWRGRGPQAVGHAALSRA